MRGGASDAKTAVQGVPRSSDRKPSVPPFVVKSDSPPSRRTRPCRTRTPNLRTSELRGVALGARQDLLIPKVRLDGQKAEPRNLLLTALYPVPDALAQHLVAAADSQSREAAPRPFGEGLVEVAGAERLQVFDGGLGAGETARSAARISAGDSGKRRETPARAQGVELREVLILAAPTATRSTSYLGCTRSRCTSRERIPPPSRAPDLGGSPPKRLP